MIPKNGMAAKSRRLILLIQLALLVMAVAAVIRFFNKSGLNSFDFHCFWYGGNHIWRRYDYVAASSFAALMIDWAGLRYRSAKRSAEERTWIFGLGFGIMVSWIFPIYRVLGPIAYRYLFNFCTLAALCLSTWLLFHWRQSAIRSEEKALS